MMAHQGKFCAEAGAVPNVAAANKIDRKRKLLIVGMDSVRVPDAA
jgi:hypothetical protein